MISPSYTEVRDAAVLPDFKSRNSSLKLLKAWPRHDFNLKKYLVKSRFLVCLRFIFFSYMEKGFCLYVGTCTTCMFGVCAGHTELDPLKLK